MVYNTAMDARSIDIEKLDTTQKLDLLEEIWDSLAKTPDAVPLTQAQREELDRRLDDLEQTGPSGVPWEEVQRRIQARGSE